QDTSRAVRDTAGKIIRYQGTLVDITERRKMERTLRRQEEFQRYLLESFPDLILVIDLNETYSFVSSRIRDLLGYHPEDFLEKKLEQQIIQSERLAAMGQMIGGFAHELNNPLTSIMGLAELLQENESSEPLRKQLAMLQQQARRAADVVQNLMYFSRPPSPGK